MIPERISPDRFAAALAERLDRVVPKGLSVRAHGSAVSLYDPSYWGDSGIADIVAEDDGRSIIERVEAAAWAIMNATQDVAMESTKEQWPIGPAGAAEPKARVVGDHLQMWFGEEAEPAVRLQPLDLRDLAFGAA